ncbi:hypothetical protein QBC35DRAFT_477021 [Podospora australis]|uniref:Uncharacterized protein n=1 Tax=Podospora australis TaxID=1536484 RepID=A0AAN7AEY2_9PEZI|nr:hypothetical protein QBC35DRAFT_477021 [Podospora australis]
MSENLPSYLAADFLHLFGHEVGQSSYYFLFILILIFILIQTLICKGSRTSNKVCMTSIKPSLTTSKPSSPQKSRVDDPRKTGTGNIYCYSRRPQQRRHAAHVPDPARASSVCQASNSFALDHGTQVFLMMGYRYKASSCKGMGDSGKHDTTPRSSMSLVTRENGQVWEVRYNSSGAGPGVREIQASRLML